MNIPLAVCIVLASVFQCGSASFAQESTRSAPLARDQVSKSEDLLSDLQILRAAYEQLHPGLYRYNSKVEMDANFDQLRAQFSHDRSVQQAYVAFSVFAAEVKCGHTYPNFFNQKREIASALFEGEHRVPFYFRWLDNQMVVTADFTPSHALSRGTQILSISPDPAVPPPAWD